MRRRSWIVVSVVVAAVAAVGLIRSFGTDRSSPPANQPTPTPTPHPSPTPSPHPRSPNGPVVVGLDRTIVLTLRGIPNGAQELDLSPDGKTIAFVKGARIGTVRLDGDDLRFITDPSIGGHSPAWSPDGSQIAFVSAGIYIVDANGKHLRRLTEGAYDADPRWSPDGADLVYWSLAQGDSYEQRNEVVYTVSSGGGAPTPITHGSSPDWSPDGAQIALIRWRSCCGFGIKIVRGDGTRSQRLPQLGGRTIPRSAIWSPDGERIAFTFTCFGQGTGGGIGVFNVATGREHGVVGCGHNRYYRDPSWLPSGNALLLDPWKAAS